jgi:hypothetical protein
VNDVDAGHHLEQLARQRQPYDPRDREHVLQAASIATLAAP